MAVAEPEFELPSLKVRDLILGNGPRFARDAFGPPLSRLRAAQRLVSPNAGHDERHEVRPLAACRRKREGRLAVCDRRLRITVDKGRLRESPQRRQHEVDLVGRAADRE